MNTPDLLEMQADSIAVKCGWANANQMRDAIGRLTKKRAPDIIPFVIPADALRYANSPYEMIVPPDEL